MKTLLSLLQTILYGWMISLWRFLKLLHGLHKRKPKGAPTHRPIDRRPRVLMLPTLAVPSAPGVAGVRVWHLMSR